MKGWHGESYRHSLAGRGIPTTDHSRYRERYTYPGDMIPEEHTFFHFTTVDRLERIRREGLRTDAPRRGDISQDGIFVATSPKSALMWFDMAKIEGMVTEEDIPVLLRIHGTEIEFDYDPSGSMWQEMGPSYVIEDDVLPEMIDVHTSEGWIPLVEMT